MFRIKQHGITKKQQVEYFGVSLDIPYSYKYIATDKSGWIFCFEDKPTIVEKHDEWWNDKHFLHIGLVKYEGDWKDSLVIIEGYSNESKLIDMEV